MDNVRNQVAVDDTDYDDDQSSERHRAACEAIAVKYPYLAEECAAQIKRRESSDEEAESYARYIQEQRDSYTEFRHVRSAESAECAAEWSVNDTCGVPHKGRWYIGRVVKKNRVTVDVEFMRKNGSEATVRAYIRDIISDTTPDMHGKYYGNTDKEPKTFPWQF